ncbi:MAG: hypothetical protein JST30_13710 [Armatimonadetes bacterium]|nr:hypothetical protein [Armatimonadota bacterium]
MKPPDDTLSSHLRPEGGVQGSETPERQVRTPEGHTLRGYLREFCRPRYHLHKIQEDFKASVHALRNRDLEVLKSDKDSLARALRGRLLATYFLVGPFGILGPLSGTYFQYWIAQNVPFLSHFVSLCSFFITIIIGNIFSIIGFQVIWAFSSATLYRMRPPAFYNWILFWKDILPLQWTGLQRWLGANVILMPLSALALSLVDRFLPSVAKAVPIGVLTPALELVFVHTSLIRLMGDLFEKESHRIAANHVH